MLRQLQSTNIRLRRAAVVIAACAGTASGGRVVIVEGHDPRPEVNNLIHIESTVAHANYLAKGYTVERLSNAMGPVPKAAVLAAFNDPNNNAFFFNGHGTQTPPMGPFVPGLVLGGGGAGGVLTPADIPAAAAARMLHVELQACGQKLPAWDAEFPNSGGVDAWNRTVTGAQVLNDIRFGSPGRIPAKAPPARGDSGDFGEGRGAPSVKTTDPRFVAAIQATPSQMANPGVDERFEVWTELGFTLPPPVAVVFGLKTFNIQTTDGVGTQVLKGLVVNGGTIVGELTGGFPAPDFILEVDAAAFATIMSDIDTLPALQGLGDVRIVADTTGLPDEILIQGAAGAYFGMFTMRPPCFADLNFDWVGNTADLVLFLGNFGNAVFPFTGGDLDGNGVVNVADLTIFLGGFGCG